MSIYINLQVNRLPHRSTLFPYTPLFRSDLKELLSPLPPDELWGWDFWIALLAYASGSVEPISDPLMYYRRHETNLRDRKSTRLNSSHLVISYAVFCLKKKGKIRVFAMNM